MLLLSRTDRPDADPTCLKNRLRLENVPVSTEAQRLVGLAPLFTFAATSSGSIEDSGARVARTAARRR
jgi:hypothetical protein